MEPFVSVDYLDEGLVPWFEGTKRVVSKRVTMGIAWHGRENTYSLSTGFTLNVSDLLPVIYRFIEE